MFSQMTYPPEYFGTSAGRLQVSGKGGVGDLVQAFQKKWWIKSDLTARQTPHPLPMWFSFPTDGSRISGSSECIDVAERSVARKILGSFV